MLCLLHPTYRNSYPNGQRGFGYSSSLSGSNISASRGGASASARAGTNASATSASFNPRNTITKEQKDKPCKSRLIPGQSVVCVCNVTYCDELVRLAPAQGKYVTYTSSEAGSRFKRTIRDLRAKDLYESNVADLVLDPSHKYQKVEGFGGAVTDAASINWMNLTNIRLKNALINSYYSKLGLEYNMLRVPIGGCDFSTHPYAYNEHPSDDLTLSNFTLAHEDYYYKIPMIKAIMAASMAPVHVVATTWSPPLWMKTAPVWGQLNELQPKYYQTYADYHIKFMEEYKAHGIPIWGITTTNEPINGMIEFAEFNSLGWSPIKQGKWIAENLGPTVRNSSFRDIKILALDDQRSTLPAWFNVMLLFEPKALQYIDGVALHFYFDKIIPPKILSLVYDNYPDKFLISTEACEAKCSRGERACPTAKLASTVRGENVINGDEHRTQKYLRGALWAGQVRT
ncbi:hypothetical protein evm_001377 [Chilo suppressalis]|nr:hypothetical protein evm_001377 [Chilo suppressalis]